MRNRMLALMLGLCLCAPGLLTGGRPQAQAPTPTPSPTPKPSPSPVSEQDERVEVLDLDRVEQRVRELHKLGYHVRRKNFLVAGDRVILFLDESDLNLPADDECEEDCGR